MTVNPIAGCFNRLAESLAFSRLPMKEVHMCPNRFFRRREFLISIIAATTAAASITSVAAEKNQRASTDNRAKLQTLDLQSVNAALFRPVVGMEISINGSSLGIVLTEVRMLNDTGHMKRPADIRKEPFALLLTAPAGVHLPDGIYKLSNAKLGRADVFMNEVHLPCTLSTSSPLGQAERYLMNVAAQVQSAPVRVSYQVVFN
jgi:hypothetical protein